MTEAPRLLGNRYELETLVAAGGMGQVWRARDIRLGRTVAVKVLRSEYTGDDTFRARFRAEAQLTAALAHRNIATLYDYGEQAVPDAGGETVAYLVMELVVGEPLSDVLAREGRLDIHRTLDVLRQTAAALAVAHRAGVVHRDVKPGNVLLDGDGVVKITDFGIAWSAASVPLTQTGQVVGTAHYLSPEQAAGHRASPASDVYALGMIGYECLAGRRAFDGENAVQIALRQLRDVPDPLPADVPENVRTLVARALVKEPEDRLPDGAAFRDAVDDVLAGRKLAPPADPPRTLSLAVMPRPGGRRMRRRMLVPAVALLAGAGIAAAAVQVLGEDAPTAPVAAEERSTVMLAAGDYLGRSADEVEAELGGLGLRVERVTAGTPGTEAGLVTALRPTGALEPGELVTLTVAAAPDPVPAAPEDAVVPQVVTAPEVPVPAVSAPQVAVAQPNGSGGTSSGKGSGNPSGKPKGNGNGKAKKNSA